MSEFTAQNPSSIQRMFSQISGKYDLANSILSFGIHHRWKKLVVRTAKVQSHQKILDCATGTGDLAFLFESHLRGTGQVIGSDFCEPMLKVAQSKARQKNSSVKFEFADVTQLQYPNETFDVATISFGIRNVKDPAKALSELARVVKPGGKVLILEFGQPQSRIMAKLFDFYSNKILPRIGGWISGQPQAYRYLQTSSSVFPCGDQFIQLARSTLLYDELKYTPLQFGIAYLYLFRRKK